MSIEGKLIVIDGPSGTGKDTVCPFVVRVLNAYYFHEEQSDSKRGEIAAVRNNDLLAATRLVSHRLDLYRQFVIPKLSQGIDVIANRGEISTIVYQTRKNQLSMEEVWQMHRQAEIRIPDIVVILACSREVALARIEADLESGSARKETERGSGLGGKFSTSEGDSHAEKMAKMEVVYRQYQAAAAFLVGKGVETLVVNTENISPQQVAANLIASLNHPSE